MVEESIAHYRVLEKLGEGGVGIVYKAHDSKLNRVVALRQLALDILPNKAEQARFLQEAYTAALLDHPNICTIYAIEQIDGEQFVAMEYVEGRSLSEMIAEAVKRHFPGLKVADAISFSTQIAEALHEAHSRGLVHRNVKSANIKIDSESQVKVMDFGLSALKEWLRLTRVSSTIDAIAYMAPEQLQGSRADFRTDIFSLGVVIYEMLTGHLPFRGNHEAARIYSVLHEEPERIEKYQPHTPPLLNALVHRALRKDPASRFQTAAEVVAELEKIQWHMSRPINPEPPPSGRQTTTVEAIGEQKKAYPRILLGVLAVAVLVCVLLAYWLL